MVVCGDGSEVVYERWKVVYGVWWWCMVGSYLLPIHHHESTFADSRKRHRVFLAPIYSQPAWLEGAPTPVPLTSSIRERRHHCLIRIVLATRPPVDAKHLV